MRYDAPEAYEGEFWLLGNPKAKFRGRLTLQGGNPHLWVTGALVGSASAEVVPLKEGSTTEHFLRIPERPRETATILGTLDRRGRVQHTEDVTLLECLCTNPGYNLPMVPGTDHQDWQPRLVIRGLRANEVDPAFSGIRVRFEHLDQWAGPYVLSVSSSPNDLYANETHRHLSASLGEQGVVRVTRDAIVTKSPAGDRNVVSEIWIEISGVEPMTFDELDRAIVAPLRTLFTLSLGKDCPPVRVQVGDHKHPLWYDIDPMPTNATVKDGSASTTLIPFEDLGVDGVACWLNRSPILGHLPHKVAAVIAGYGYTLENELLDLATTAEGLHRRLYPSKQRFDKDIASKARTLATEACSDLGQAVVNSVKDALSYITDPSFRDRLDDLAQDCAEIIPDAVGPDPRKWSRDIAEFRNRFAHELDKGHLKEKDILVCLACRESLHWLLLARLLREAGIPKEVLVSRINGHSRYRMFLRQAREWAPRIYEPL